MVQKRVLKFDDQGNVIREIDVGAEICGHTFANGSLYVLRGQEQPNEDWRIARVNPQEETPAVEDIAVVPFACSLTDFRRRNYSGPIIARKTRSFRSPCRIKGFSTVRHATRNQSGSKFGNISSASASVLSGTQSQVYDRCVACARNRWLIMDYGVDGIK